MKLSTDCNDYVLNLKSGNHVLIDLTTYNLKCKHSPLITTYQTHELKLSFILLISIDNITGLRTVLTIDLFGVHARAAVLEFVCNSITELENMTNKDLDIGIELAKTYHLGSEEDDQLYSNSIV